MDNIKKATSNSPRSALKRNNRVEEGGALGLGVKREHDMRFPKGEEHLHFEGDVCEDWMETNVNPKHFQLIQQHL